MFVALLAYTLNRMIVNDNRILINKASLCNMSGDMLLARRRLEPYAERGVKASDLNVKAAVILGVEINLDVNKGWDALRDLLLKK